jgi:hypothetical protein
MSVAGWDIDDKRARCSPFIVRLAEKMRSPFLESRSDVHFLDIEETVPIFLEASRREKEDPKFNSLRFIHDQILEVLLKRKKPPE